jgi:hypothetical protein
MFDTRDLLGAMLGELAEVLVRDMRLHWGG